MDIELVIKIPEEDFERCKKKFQMRLNVIAIAIAKGKPLPEGHGRIIDESQVTGTFTWDNGYIECYAPTIIEADKEDK